MKIWLACVFSLLSCFAFAEQKQRIGPWDVHYLAFNATFLTPEVARNYGIERSRFTGIVNLSVLSSDDQSAQLVNVTGTARNLLGQQRTLRFQQVRDGAAIYYFAPLTIRNEELWRFDIQLQQGNEQQRLHFEHTYYID